ncbi:polyphosphate polymerase domain-containing protein [Microbacterium protaetiae]|uniref:Polyphosphate polymerase domain-containing protein n=1 Tax=Microbacterium protaetiae TaxID=2509458 RepID=A0A4P6ER20_9MICO|nr:polyphosphate polymerase domain-containing protein [Microbacterium protaetiae]QAY60318.1 polyphosphate polymerase domain-containing protein [Microbacterium protaetiae]
MSTLETVPAVELTHFSPIDLTELNALAALQTRVDRKYIIPAAELPRIVRCLPGSTRMLHIDGTSTLTYASRYFDTPELDSYLRTARGRRRRFKVRARTYVDSGDSFLEVKTKSGRSATVKQRVPVARGELDAAAREHAAGLLAAADIPAAEHLAHRLRPTMDSSYRRITLLLPSNVPAENSRTTIDIDLEWRAPGRGILRLDDRVIVETKSGRRAGAMDRALWRAGHRPASISKYGTGMAALYPTLPSNKWRRTLTRHFAGAERFTDERTSS